MRTSPGLVRALLTITGVAALVVGPAPSALVRAADGDGAASECGCPGRTTVTVPSLGSISTLVSTTTTTTAPTVADSTTTTQGPLPDDEICLQSNAGLNLACLWVDDEHGNYPDGGVCVHDDAVSLVVPWFEGSELGCVYTVEADRHLDGPGACSSSRYALAEACLNGDRMCLVTWGEANGVWCD